MRTGKLNQIVSGKFATWQAGERVYVDVRGRMCTITRIKKRDQTMINNVLCGVPLTAITLDEETPA